MNTLIYDGSRLLGCLLAKIFFRLRCLGFEQLSGNQGPCLLICNHISHFDPPLWVIAVRQRFYFMTWDRLFSARWFALWLKAVGCFPVNTARPDFRATRHAVRYLREKKTVGLFPEGGIRTGKSSVLEQASLRRSVAVLADLGRCPVRVCLILGSDRLYDWKQWAQRPDIILFCGKEFFLNPALKKKEARQALTDAVQNEFHRLYQEAFTQFRLSPEMVPRTVQERMRETPDNKTYPA